MIGNYVSCCFIYRNLVIGDFGGKEELFLVMMMFILEILLVSFVYEGIGDVFVVWFGR